VGKRRETSWRTAQGPVLTMPSVLKGELPKLTRTVKKPNDLFWKERMKRPPRGKKKKTKERRAKEKKKTGVII